LWYLKRSANARSKRRVRTLFLLRIPASDFGLPVGGPILIVKGVTGVMRPDEIILTAGSKKQKEEELTYLRTVKRPEITEAIKRAREYGDLSENFEYQAARQAQAILNGRIAELEALLERARVVDDAAAGGDTVGLGSIVAVKDLETEDEWEYTIVDATSADPANDRISYTSPVGKALMHHKIGDVVEVAIPAGTARYEIMGLRHE
jgi:transcription elongation factor GreA